MIRALDLALALLTWLMDAVEVVLLLFQTFLFQCENAVFRARLSIFQRRDGRNA